GAENPTGPSATASRSTAINRTRSPRFSVASSVETADSVLSRNALDWLADVSTNTSTSLADDCGSGLFGANPAPKYCVPSAAVYTSNREDDSLLAADGGAARAFAANASTSASAATGDDLDIDALSTSRECKRLSCERFRRVPGTTAKHACLSCNLS